MHYDINGIYTLKYTAEDDCGNETVRERRVIVGTPRTVIYTDGTFIINEQPDVQPINEARHGGSAYVYDPFDPNGDTDVKKYIFATSSACPWNAEKNYILSAEIGENISPTSTAYWFSALVNATEINLSGLDTSLVTDMNHMFNTSGKRTDPLVLDLSSFDTSNVENMNFMFNGLHASSIDISSFNTAKVTNMANMFSSMHDITSLDLSNFDTSSVTSMRSMFYQSENIASLNLLSFDTSAVTDMGGMFNDCMALTSLDLSSFDTSSVTDMGGMFRFCYGLTTIYASASFVVDQVTSSTNMFGSAAAPARLNIVGGAGTVWVSNKTNKEYARIDNPPSAPGYFTAKP